MALWVTNFKGKKLPFMENDFNYFRNDKNIMVIRQIGSYGWVWIQIILHKGFEEIQTPPSSCLLATVGGPALNCAPQERMKACPLPASPKHNVWIPFAIPSCLGFIQTFTMFILDSITEFISYSICVRCLYLGSWKSFWNLEVPYFIYPSICSSNFGQFDCILIVCLTIVRGWDEISRLPLWQH